MANYSIPVTDTDAVQALLDEVQHRCTARIYDADDICKLAEKTDQLRRAAREAADRSDRLRCTFGSGRKARVLRLHGRRDWGPASSS